MRVIWKKFNIEGTVIRYEYETTNTFLEVHFVNGMTKYIHISEIKIIGD